MKRKPNKIKGQKAEKRIALTINSGALWFDKGDLKTEDCLIDSKMTDKKSFSITCKMLEKLHDEALDRNRFPVLVVTIERPECRWLLKVEVNKEVK